MGARNQTKDFELHKAITYPAPEGNLVVGSAWGRVTNLEWCLREVERIRQAGRDARVGRANGSCWVSRL
jgi:hypothetical protein